MEAMYLRAWIDGLHRLSNERPESPVEPLPGYVRLDDPTRPATVALRGGQRRA